MKVLKLTLKNVKKLRNETESGLTKYVCDYIIDNWDSTQDDDDNKYILTNILNGGCESGACSNLIYYADTLKFYDDYESEINYLLSNLLDDCGIKSPAELFGDKWDYTDPLACADENKNLLAWFGFEETITNIARKFGIE